MADVQNELQTQDAQLTALSVSTLICYRATQFLTLTGLFLVRVNKALG